MLLLRWRNLKGLTIAEATRRLGFTSQGMLSEIERGISFPQPQTIVQIEAATFRQVTAVDHLDAWMGAHETEQNTAWGIGLNAALSFKSASERASF